MPSTQVQSGLVTETIPNLVGGVSQEPDALRHPTQAEEILNAFPSLTEGLKRRPPTNLLADVTNVFTALQNLGPFVTTFVASAPSVQQVDDIHYATSPTDPSGTQYIIKIYLSFILIGTVFYTITDLDTDTSIATGIAAAINATPSLSPILVATASGIQVLITFNAPGVTYVTTISRSFDNVVLPPGGCFAHVYNRDLTERYILLIVNGDLKVFSLVDGSQKTVTFPNGKGYLASQVPGDQFRAVTVGDFTFLVNRTVTVEQLSTLSPAETFEALVWVRIGDYGVTYSIALAGANYKFTSDLTHRDEVTTDYIAKALLSKIATGKNVTTITLSGTYAIGDSVTVTDGTETDIYTVKAGPDGTVENYHEICRGLAASINANTLATTWHIFAYVEGDSQLIISGVDSTDNHTWTSSTSGAGGHSDSTFTQPHNFNVTRAGSTLHITLVTPNLDFVLATDDGLGDQSIRAIKGKIQRFEDLPARAVDGFRMEITGDDKAVSTHSVFVQYSDEGLPGGDGVWKESLKGGEKIALDPATMPWILVRNNDGTFTFKQGVWTNRLVGDLNGGGVFPSFLGQTLDDVFFHKNRLGVASQENVVMSPSGDYFNFFRKSVMQLLADDLIDFATANVQISFIRHVTPHENSAVMWSDEQQFNLTVEPLLTPKTVSAPSITAFDCSQRVKPAPVGKDIFFCSDREGSTKVMEMELTLNSIGQITADASEITTAVPSYLKGNPVRIAGGTNMDMLAVATQSNASDLYLYKWSYNGNQVLQSAWHKWNFGGEGGNILAVEFIENKIFLVIQRGSSVFLEVIYIIPDDKDAYTDHLTYLDARITDKFAGVTVAYNSGTNQTTWTLPFNLPVDSSNPVKVVKRATATSVDTTEIPNATQPAPNKVAVLGAYTTTPVWIGVSFFTDFDFSVLYTRDYQTNVAITEARTDVKFMDLKYAKTGFFQVQVTPPGRTNPYTYTFDAGVLNNTAKGAFHIPVQAQNETVSIRLTTNDPRPCSFVGATWTALVSQRTRRLI